MTLIEGHGGDFIAEAMRFAGVDALYTLSGGHIFPVFDGLHTRGMRIIDVRHEQTAAFAAEAYGKLSRKPGVAALTAGPGVTNGISAITSAFFNGSPMVVIGGRAPQLRWGQGSLQEMDHIPLVKSITKHAETVFDPAKIFERTQNALHVAKKSHSGPVFLDVPLEVLFTRSAADTKPAGPYPYTMRSPKSDGLIAKAERPVLLLGSDVWAGRAESQARAFVERQRIPTFMNGMGRGIIPADHELAFSNARAHAFAGADLIIVAGTPLDFRLGFGKFGDAKVIHIADSEDMVAKHVPLAASEAGILGAIFEKLAEVVPRNREDWIAELRKIETEKRSALQQEMHVASTPIHPARVYGELLPRIKRDAIIICDGGDFVSYAGKLVDVFEPGCWLDPGAYGCLGTGPGYALAASTLYPDRQIILLLGDGAAGFSMGDWDTLVRFGVNVTIIVGNNGIWGLEKHPMKFVYGYDVAADLRPETRYDQVLSALGGYGQMVTDPEQLGDAIDRALAFEGPSMVNVITDPSVAYPRSSNLA
ncbi:MAG: acetolactate synthase [Actinomycetota bacterium]